MAPSLPKIRKKLSRRFLKSRWRYSRKLIRLQSFLRKRRVPLDDSHWVASEIPREFSLRGIRRRQYHTMEGSGEVAHTLASIEPRRTTFPVANSTLTQPVPSEAVLNKCMSLVRIPTRTRGALLWACKQPSQHEEADPEGDNKHFRATTKNTSLHWVQSNATPISPTNEPLGDPSPAISGLIDDLMQLSKEKYEQHIPLYRAQQEWPIASLTNHIETSSHHHSKLLLLKRCLTRHVEGIANKLLENVKYPHPCILFCRFYVVKIVL